VIYRRTTFRRRGLRADLLFEQITPAMIAVAEAITPQWLSMRIITMTPACDDPSSFFPAIPWFALHSRFLWRPELPTRV
jgi:hypothetical protein